MSEDLSGIADTAETTNAEFADSECFIAQDVPVWELTAEELRALYTSAYELYRRLDTTLYSVKEDEFEEAFERYNESKKRVELLFAEVALRKLNEGVNSRARVLVLSLYDDNSAYEKDMRIIAAGDSGLIEAFEIRLYRAYNKTGERIKEAMQKVILEERMKADPGILFTVKRPMPIDTNSMSR